MRRLPFIPLTLLTLAACTSVAGLLGAHVNAYSGKERPIGEVAVLLPKSWAQFAKVDGKHVGDSAMGYPRDVRVLPGERHLDIDCIANSFPFRTQFTGRFEAGHFYNVECIDQGKGNFTCNLKDLGTQDPRAKRE